MKKGLILKAVLVTGLALGSMPAMSEARVASMGCIATINDPDLNCDDAMEVTFACWHYCGCVGYMAVCSEVEEDIVNCNCTAG